MSNSIGSVATAMMLSFCLEMSAGAQALSGAGAAAGIGNAAEAKQTFEPAIEIFQAVSEIGMHSNADVLEALTACGSVQYDSLRIVAEAGTNLWKQLRAEVDGPLLRCVGKFCGLEEPSKRLMASITYHRYCMIEH